MKTDNFYRRATDVHAPENDQNVHLKSSVLQQLIKTTFEGDISESKISYGNSVPDREIKSCLSEKDSNSSWRIIKVVKESDLIAENELRAEEQTQTASENIDSRSLFVFTLFQFQYKTITVQVIFRVVLGNFGFLKAANTDIVVL